MSGSETRNPPDWAPWRHLLTWAPFKIDALGLVTLLGAEEVNASVGRLVRSRWLEYLPLLGAYVVAGDRFRSKEPGYSLYNITQGIHSPDLASWLTRWIKSQNLTSRNFVRWTVIPPRHRPWDDLIASMISVCLVGMLFALTILQYDMYGLGSTIGTGVSVFVRWYMIRSVRETIDDRVSEMCKEKKDEQKNLIPVTTEDLTYEGRMKSWKAQHTAREAKSSSKLEKDPENDADSSGTEAVEEPHRLACGWNGKRPVKAMIVTSEAVAIAMMIPKELMGPRSVFSATLPPRYRFWYAVARWSGWIAFAVQVVTIGQADLITQICTVALLVIPTVLYVGKFGCDDSNWMRNITGVFSKFVAKPKLNQATQKKKHEQFAPVSVSQIGSRLLAEVYEWPLSHDFLEPTDGTGHLTCRLWDNPPKGERTSRRMHLYAWLQLSEDERLSMDKWDLFPHERGDNKEWMDEYKHCRKLISKLSSPGGSINSIKGTEGAQDIIDISTAATHQAEDSASSPTTETTRRGEPAGTAPDPGAANRPAGGESAVADDSGTHESSTGVHFADGTEFRGPRRTGTNLTTTSTGQLSVGSQHSSGRRPSFAEHNPAFWASNVILQERAEREEQQGVIDSADGSAVT